MIIVGAGASGLVASILIKQKYPNIDVLLLEKNNIVGKKLKATGSGRCNIAPINESLNEFYNVYFAKKSIGDIPSKEYFDTLKSFGIITKQVNNVGYYPISESALSVVKLLEGKALGLGIKIILDTKVVDYSIKDRKVFTSTKKKYDFDYLVFTNGGASYSSLGGEDSLSNIFFKHGYSLAEFKPVLTPIKVKENIHKLFGVRLDAKVTLTVDNEKVFSENGEIQFRKDGLSGIVILNASRYVDLGAKCSLSFNALSVGKKEFNELYTYNKDFLLTLLPKELVNYGLSRLNIEPNNIEESDLHKIYNYFTNITFNVSGLFPLEYATVSRGGIKVDNLNFDFSSKKEKNVYFLGEIIDVDAPCGGYSLKFTISSAIKFAKEFKLIQ